MELGLLLASKRVDLRCEPRIRKGQERKKTWFWDSSDFLRFWGEAEKSGEISLFLGREGGLFSGSETEGFKGKGEEGCLSEAGGPLLEGRCRSEE